MTVTDQNTHSPAAEAKTQTAATVKAAEAAPAKAAEAAKPAKAPAAQAATPARRTARKAAKAAPAPRKTPQRRTVKTVRAAKQTINHSINEGTRTMKKEANQMADRMQAVFGDYNERAKTAFERNARLTEELTELSKGNVEALVASTKVAARGVETIGQEVAELSRRSFEEASAALRSFVEVKSPTDFFRLQGEFARGQFDSFVAESAKMSEALIKLAGDVAEPLTSRYTVAAEKVKTAVAL